MTILTSRDAAVIASVSPKFCNIEYRITKVMETFFTYRQPPSLQDRSLELLLVVILPSSFINDLRQRTPTGVPL